jgi:MoaA/NifB/PqqE/SkfB family radical SAM enzyme
VKELTLDEIVNIYRNPLFDSIERLGLSGGEPTLREDLVEIVEAILSAQPQLQHVMINTNGLDTDTVVNKINGLLTMAERKHLKDFTVIVSVDGYGDTHERIRRIPDAFKSVNKTINSLKLLRQKIPFYLCLVCVVQPQNLDSLVDMAKFSQEMQLPITFSPVLYSSTLISEDTTREPLRFQESQLEKLRILFGRDLQPSLTLSNSLFWREYFTILSGGKRKIPCVMRNYHAGVDCNGTLYMCNSDLSLAYGDLHKDAPDRIWYSEKAREIRKKAKQHFCPECTACCDVAFSLRTEFFYAARSLLTGKYSKRVTE